MIGPMTIVPLTDVMPTLTELGVKTDRLVESFYEAEKEMQRGDHFLVFAEQNLPVVADSNATIDFYIVMKR